MSERNLQRIEILSKLVAKRMTLERRPIVDRRPGREQTASD
ncbi:hypothetical protein [Pseudorhodoplanes sp.]|nr:hypothetical protein [Pseudorhodoplanes sp.]HWV55810.1 hypothetical protein [Pseudorhodoplanes sp.]